MNPILAVGSVAFDSIKTPFGEASRVVGGAATYFAIAASFFAEVRIVAVVGEDFGANVEKVFGGRTIDLSGLEKVPFKQLYEASAIGFMMLIILPFRLGEFARPFLIAQRSGIRRSAAMTSVVFERISPVRGS